ncbi:MAG: GNAT family N-acetyltransferase [Campylobacterota bacterium]|nr:GNAT family N-acetyltransferase [Campylobacterota bacterium]
MITVALDAKQHNRNSFDCGVEALNNYLKLTANQQSNRDNSRTYILEDKQESNRIVGFYTLTMASADVSSFPLKLQKKYKHNNSVALIARLAVDKEYMKQSIGSWLLVDALKKLLNASDTIGFPLVIVDSKDGVSGFYEKYGFKSFEDNSNKLFISIADVRASFQ